MRGTKPRSKSYFKVLFSFIFTIFSYSYKRKFLLSKRSLKSIFSKNAVLKKIPKIYLFEKYIRCYENEEMFWLERMFSIVLVSSSFSSFFTFLGFFWLLLCFTLLFYYGHNFYSPALRHLLGMSPSSSWSKMFWTCSVV